MSSDAVDWTAIDALAREVIAEESPAELPLFNATAARYRTDPSGTLSAGSRTDETLGFGVETAVVLLAPFAIELVKRIFTKVAEEVGDQAGESLAARITRMFHKDSTPQGSDGVNDAPHLTPEQLALVGRIAREEAAQLKLPEAKADALANGVVAALAVRA
jgi:hypothetical protein